ncbi:MAG: prolyl aminopeptidase [Candidatus Microsaccharimonas sp.]
MQKDSYTLKERMIDVGDNHQLYTQLWGSPTAKETIIFLHGGPGSGCNDGHKLLFDPNAHKVLFFDQRGAGKSLPKGSLLNNTTEALVNDITTIASHYGITSFALTGGSWGSCLALAYGLKHPKKVTRMVLRGIFTGRQSEIDFIDKGQFRTFFPEVWERFAASVPTEAASEPAAYHQARIFNNDESARKASFAYSELEGSISTLDDRAALPNRIDPASFDPTGSTIETHYLVNTCFLEEGYIMKNASKLTMPIALVQGRYDMVCPPCTAYELHKALPNSSLTWTIAGHSGNDRANFDAVKLLLTTKSY